MKEKIEKALNVIVPQNTYEYKGFILGVQDDGSYKIRDYKHNVVGTAKNQKEAIKFVDSIMSKVETKHCCICGDELSPNECNNAEPLVMNGNGIEAVCCDYCNKNKVLPYRMIDSLVKDPIIRVMAKTTFIYEFIKDSNTMKLSFLSMCKDENIILNNKEGK